MLLTTEAIEGQLDQIAAGAFLGNVEDLARPALELLTPPNRISTTESASRYRLIPDKEGDGASLWDPALTPYMNGVQDALDDPEVGLVIVPKPARTGGTIAAENHLHKRLKFGPLTDVLWYLPSDTEVDAYVRRHVKKIFELHPDIAAKIGTGKSDDTMTFKVVAGRNLEWLQLNSRTVTGRDAGFIVGDEIDSMNRKLRGTFVDQVRVRGTTAGTSFKGYLCSHMDAGWTSGIAAAWKESSRGIFYWPCPRCRGWSSPCPTAEDGWRMVLSYDRPKNVSDDEILETVERTAGLKCPHCGKKALDADKPEMLLRGRWVHEGQSIDRRGRITGAPRSKRILGFWIHGAMSPWVSFGDLARRYVAALMIFERTKKPERLREVTAKVLGEVYEGTGGQGAVDAVRLRTRATELATARGYEAGVVPDGVRFITAAVDVGHRKFDVMIVGWDLEGRSWIIDRFTILTRRVDAKDRDIRPAERQTDWYVIEDQVLNRELRLAHEPGLRMPIAAVSIDTGDGNVTWKAREFARQMTQRGHYWGSAAQPWTKVRLIKGSKSPEAPELPVVPREVSKDEKGRPIVPSLKEYDLGVHRLKKQVVERLAEAEGGPGQVFFANGLPASTYDEFAGEVLIDEKWERRGPNESLDLHAYAEAARLMLRPDRAEINWDERPPIWARPVPIKTEVELEERDVAAPPKQTALARMAALNRRK